jgi:Arc/MetJ family transcription regulator
MSKTSVVVDQDIARQAAAILGTNTLRETIDAALREIVRVQARLEAVAMMSVEGRFNFGKAEEAWGGPE